MEIEGLASSTLALVCSGTGECAGVSFGRPPIFILNPNMGAMPRERLVMMTNEGTGTNHMPSRTLSRFRWPWPVDPRRFRSRAPGFYSHEVSVPG